MIVKEISKSTIPVVTVSEVKNYLRLDEDLTADDNLVETLIWSAINVIERMLDGVPIVEKEFEQSQRGGGWFIPLMRKPITEVISVKYNGFYAGTVVMEENRDYRVTAEGLYPSRDTAFPTGRPGDGYVINFKAGIAKTASEVPEDLKVAALRLVAFWYENRAEYLKQSSTGGISTSYEAPSWLYPLLAGHRTGQGAL